MSMITPAFIQEVFEHSQLLFTAQQIQEALDNMALAITEKLAGKNPVMLPVMNGGLMTAGELMKRLNFPMQIDYIHATRYSGETRGGTSIHWRKQPDLDLEGRAVLIVDDILDGGLTLSALLDFCDGVGAGEVFTAVLLDKVNARAEGAIAHADFCGLTCGNEYVFGFGLDYHEYLRNVPAIYTVAPQHML